MNKLLIGTVLTGAVLCFEVGAEEIEFSGSASIVSQYIWRGWVVNEDASAQAEFAAVTGGFSAAIWAGSDGTLGDEIDLVLNYSHDFNDDLGLEVGIIQYKYSDSNNDVTETHLKLYYDFVDFIYHDGEGGYKYLEVNAGFELSDRLSMELHAGYEDLVWGKLNDYQIKFSLDLDDTFSLFVSVSDKENWSSEVAAGIMGSF